VAHCGNVHVRFSTVFILENVEKIKKVKKCKKNVTRIKNVKKTFFFTSMFCPYGAYSMGAFRFWGILFCGRFGLGAF